MMTAREAAAALGGQATSPRTLLCPGPGHSTRDRSLSVRLDPEAPDGFTCHSFSGDDWQACRDHIRAALGLGLWRDRRTVEAAPEPRTKPVPDEAAIKAAAARRFWTEARDPRGTIAEAYLASRALELPDDPGRVLRFHPCPAMPFEKPKAPGLLGLFRDVHTDEPRGLQRVFLRPDGSKLERKMLGPVAGAAVKLDDNGDVSTTLAIAEGIETALAARQLGYRPCWAVGSVGAIATLEVIPYIERLSICGEVDDHGKNAAAVRICAKRWLDDGAEVSIVEPDAGDLNDVLLARRAR